MQNAPTNSSAIAIEPKSLAIRGCIIIFCLTSKLSHAEDDIQNFHKLLAKNCNGHTHWLQRLVRLLRLGDLES